MRRLVIAITTAWSVRNILLSGLASRVGNDVDIVLAIPKGFPRSMDFDGYQVEEFDPAERIETDYLRVRERLGMAHKQRTNPVGAAYALRLRQSRRPLMRKAVAAFKHLRAQWEAGDGSYARLVSEERRRWEAVKNVEVGRKIAQWGAHAMFFPVPHTRAEWVLSRWSRTMGIPTAAMILSFDNLTTKGRHSTVYNEYYVWNHRMKAELIAAYPEVSLGQVWITGTPQFQFYFMPQFNGTKEDLCELFGLDTSRPIVTYAAGPESLVRHEVPIVSRLAADLKSKPNLRGAQMVVRLHPIDHDRNRWAALRAAHPEVKWSFPWSMDANLQGIPERKDILTLCLLMHHSAAVINCASTMTLDALVCGTPAICVDYALPPFADFAPHVHNFYDYVHYRPITSSGAVPIARSPEELLSKLQTRLSNRSALLQERGQLLGAMAGESIDKATDRLASRLVAFVRSRE